jgi:hypothetical protein
MIHSQPGEPEHTHTHACFLSHTHPDETRPSPQTVATMENQGTPVFLPLVYKNDMDPRAGCRRPSAMSCWRMTAPASIIGIPWFASCPPSAVAERQMGTNRSPVVLVFEVGRRGAAGGVPVGAWLGPRLVTDPWERHDRLRKKISPRRSQG